MNYLVAILPASQFLGATDDIVVLPRTHGISPSPNFQPSPMAYTNIELRETNIDRQNVGNELSLDNQQWNKPPLHDRLIKTLTPRIQHRPSSKVKKRPDDLEQLLEAPDGISNVDPSAGLREDYALFKDRPGVELIDSLILFQCFVPPLAGNVSFQTPESMLTCL